MRFVFVSILLLVIMPITGSWWAEGSNVLLDPTLVCNKPRRLKGKLAEICEKKGTLLKVIERGINMGYNECEAQFKHRRWNCTKLKKSMKKILIKDTRETGFVNAIRAAGIIYTVTRACTMGDLVECSCDKNHHGRRNHNNVVKLNNNNNSTNISSSHSNSHPNSKPKNNRIQQINPNINSSVSNVIDNNSNSNKKQNNNNNNKNYKDNIKNNFKNKKIGKNIVIPDGHWEWGGCDDNFNFGYKKSKDFLDARYKKRSDIKTLIKLHNNEAGRLAIKQFMRLECKCHGLSGSCTMKTCWMKMPLFHEVGNRLKERFDGAVKVIANNDGNSFKADGETIKKPERNDLVYTEESPDFCRPNHKIGSLGTHGRECNITSYGIDGCELLCCNRGFDRKIKQFEVNCKCRFKWCCEVSCSKCIENREVYSCK